MRVHPFRSFAQVAGSALLAALSACASTGWYEHRFLPAPLESQVTAQGVAGSQVRALVTVLGIEHGRDGAKDHALVRLRLENLGTAPASFSPEATSLVTADLTEFDAPKLVTKGSLDIAPGSTGEYDVAFPLPKGKGPYDLDLSGVNFRFTIAFGTEKVTMGMTFQRSDWRYLEGGYPRVHVGVGFGWYDHH